METIRYAAKTHGGLGWCMHDHKFRYKAAACVTLSWANIDMQLRLRIFTAIALLSCGKAIPFCLTAPQTKLGQRGGRQFVTATTGIDLAHYFHWLKTQKMNYHSVFLATTVLIGEKSSTSCLIARHLDEKSRDCKQRIEY
jgi:hypothetical protein